ncbi:MAG: SdpI family protein [Terracidiphilus sp.]|jgi:uncharacterized membrane protein
MTRKIFIFEILSIAAVLATTVVVYRRLPGRIPVHWDIHGRADGFGPPSEMFLIGPGLMAGMMLLTWLLPWLSPKRFDVEAFQSTYRQLMAIVFCLCVYAYGVTLWAALSHPIDPGRAICGGLSIFIALMGNLMGKVRRNFFIGVRTPWTLASERVWNATHRFAGRAMVAAGLLGLVFTIVGPYMGAVWLLLAASAASIVYSLVYYKQLERRGELGDRLTRG